MIHDTDKDKNDFDDFEEFDDGFDDGDDFASGKDEVELDGDDAIPGDDWDEFENDTAVNTDQTKSQGMKKKKSGKGNLVLIGGIAGIALLAGGGYYLMQPAGMDAGTQPVASIPSVPIADQDQFAETGASAGSIPAPSPISNLDEPVEETFVPDYQVSLEQELEQSANTNREGEFTTTDTLRNRRMGQPVSQNDSRQFLTPVPDPILSPEVVELEPLEDDVNDPISASPESSDIPMEMAAAPSIDLTAETTRSGDFRAELEQDMARDFSENDEVMTEAQDEFVSEDSDELLDISENTSPSMPGSDIPDAVAEADAIIDTNMPEPPGDMGGDTPGSAMRTINQEPALAEANQKIASLESTISELKSTIETMREEMQSLRQAKDTAQRSDRNTAPSSAPEKAVSAKPETKPEPKPVVKTQQTPQVTSADIWIMRSAQPGRAVLFNKNTSDFITVEAGKTLTGLGRIESIGLEDGKWVVKGTQGQVSQ